MKKSFKNVWYGYPKTVEVHLKGRFGTNSASNSTSLSYVIVNFVLGLRRITFINKQKILQVNVQSFVVNTGTIAKI